MTIRLSHRTARVLGAVGRALIGFGLITLLFVAYQLWGTGLQHARAQDQLESDFQARLEATADVRDSMTTTSTPTTTVPLPERGLGSSRPIEFPGVTTTTTTAPEPEPVDPELLAALSPRAGEPIAQLRIPSIGVDETVVYGIGVADLRKGPGVFPSNPLPGTAGNAAIAGHRTTYGAPFHNLDLINPGDEIVVTTLRGEFTYVVSANDDGEGNEIGHFIVPDTGVEVLEDYGDNRITLIACHPKFSARQRIIVTGILQEEPVEPPPTTVPEPEDDDDGSSPPTTLPDPLPEEDFGEGLDGDPAALTPTLIWAGLFGLGLLVTWFLGTLWRRWPVYLLSSPLLAWLLWTCFVYLDQLLPSY